MIENERYCNFKVLFVSIRLSIIFFPFIALDLLALFHLFIFCYLHHPNSGVILIPLSSSSWHIRGFPHPLLLFCVMWGSSFVTPEQQNHDRITIHNSIPNNPVKGLKTF